MAFDYIPNEFGRAWVSSQFYNRRGVHTPLAFIDINEGNRDDAYLFAQIMFWHEPNKETGQARISTLHNGHLWLVRKHSDWFKETRMKKETVRACLRRLKERGLIFYELVGKKGQESPYVRVNWNEFERRMKLWMMFDSTTVEEETYQHFVNQCQYEEGSVVQIVAWLPYTEQFGHFFQDYLAFGNANGIVPPCENSQPPVNSNTPPCENSQPPLLENTGSQVQNGAHIESLESIDSNTERTLSDGTSDGAPPIVVFETASPPIQEKAVSQPVEQPIEATPIQEATPPAPKPKIDLWEYATLKVWPGGTKYWRNILNMLSGRSKTGQWAEWNFEEEMRPKSPAVILAFKRYMTTEEDENGELKYEKMRFPEKPEAIYKYWGFFRACKRYDRLVAWGEMQLSVLQELQTPPAETPAPAQPAPTPAPIEGATPAKRLTVQEMIDQMRPKMHVNTIIREREAQKKAAGQ